MRKTSLRSAVFILLLAVLASTTGCRKETNNISESCRVVSELISEEDPIYHTLYKYDEQGRIETIVGSLIDARITYQTDSALIEWYSTSGSLDYTYGLAVDGRGRFTSHNGSTYIYNADGTLLRHEVGNEVIDYTWHDGDLMHAVSLVNGVPVYDYTYTYYTEFENKTRWDYDNTGFNCFFGLGSKHLIKHKTTLYLTLGDTSEIDWSYQFNDKGLPTQITKTINGQANAHTTHYTYECR